MQTTCKMYEKIVVTRKNTIRVLYSFNKVKITVLNCVYTSGDLGHMSKRNLPYIKGQINNTHAFVTKAFSTDNIIVIHNCLAHLEASAD